MTVADSKATLAKPSSRSQVILIPWDPDSEEHVQRLYDQRVACGWKSHFVEEKWRHLQRQSKMAIHWVVRRPSPLLRVSPLHLQPNYLPPQILSPEDPQKESKLQAHITAYPNEATPVHDTAKFLGGEAREIPQPPREFIPVGHISLDSYCADPELADPKRGIYYVSTLYISHALQGRGLGRAAMDAIESMAVEPPLNAKALALDTLAREQAVNLEFWKEVQAPPPRVCFVC
jgi:GNAT superfamily N-acetyltransferase